MIRAVTIMFIHVHVHMYFKIFLCKLSTCTCILVISVGGESSLTIWVATKTGKLCVYIINTVSQQGKQRKIDLLPSG